MSNILIDCGRFIYYLSFMNAIVEAEFLEILRKTCRTVRHSRNRPELSIPAAEWEIKINARMQELEKQRDQQPDDGHREAA